MASFLFCEVTMNEKQIYKIIMQEYRCSNCDKLLFKGKIRGEYKIEVKCPRCKNITEFNRTIKKNTT